MRIALAVCAAAGGIALIAVVLGHRADGNPRSPARAAPAPDSLALAIRDFKPRQIRFVIPPDQIRSIDHPVFDSASRVKLFAREPVIGVVVHGRARAYATRILSAHEIVNDDVAGQPFVVTW